MKLAFFDDFRLGVVVGDTVVDVSAVVSDIPHIRPHELMSGLIERFDAYRNALLQAAAKDRGIPLRQVRIRPPLPKPYNIDCMAMNYSEDPSRLEPVTAPINAFNKAASGVIGDGDTMVLPDVPASVFEGEAELALVIGRRASNVKAAEAMQYVFGYLNFIDGSARGLLPNSNVFFQMKSRDTFAPMGPYLVTADEVPDPQNLQVRLWVNGDLKQDYNTRHMTYKIPQCVEWMSSIHTLEPGDVLALGTYHAGLNAFQHGDCIELETEGLGRLHIRVRDDLQRTWSRETRGERLKKGLPVLAPQLSGKYAKTAG